MASFWQRVKALFGGDAPKSAGGLLASILQGGQMPRRGTRELLLAYARLPWVHSVTRRISNDVASVPVRLYRVRRAGAKDIRRAAPGPIRKAMVQDAARAGDLEAIDAHPFLTLYSKWNPALGGQTSRMLLQLWLDLAGEGFGVKERSASGEPLELWPIPPHWMADTPSAPSPSFRASYQGWNRLLPESEVLWAKMPNPENPYGRGVGLGEALGDELDIDEASTKLLRNWFFNSAIPPVIVNLPETGPEEAERFKQRLFEEHGGPTKANRVMVTNALSMDVKQLVPTFKEQEIPELRAAAKEIVVQVFNVPPECMGILENSNRATIDAAHYLYTTGVLCPRLDFLVGALEPLLAEFDGGEELVLDYVSPVQEDKEYKRQVFLQAPAGTFTRNEYRALACEPPVDDEVKGEPIYQYHLQFGIVTINEARERLGLPPIADGDVPPTPPDLFGLGGGEEMAAAPQLLKAAPRLLPARITKDLNVERVLEALRPERLTDETGPVFERRMEKWGNRVLRELGIAASFSMKNPLIREHLETLAAKKISGHVMETTRQAIRDTLAEGVAAGEGIASLSGRVMDVFDLADKVRARRIARTEVVGSSNLTNLAAFAQSGVVAKKEWLSVRDGNTRTEHAELDGQTVGVTEFFSVDGHRAQHPGGFGVAEMDINCFPGDARFAPGSRVTRLYRRQYAGPVVVLDVEGRGPSRSTPNHPVLTAERGWQPAESLKLGEHVVCLGNESGELGVDHPERGESMLAEQVFGALAPLGVAERIAGSASQFHGDGRNEEVDVVALDWRLWGELDSALTQEVCEAALAVADQLRAPGSALAQFLYGPLAPSNGSMRGLGKLLPLLATHAAHPDEHRRTATSWLNASLDKVSTHHGTRAAEALRQLFLADASLVESHQATARQLYRIGARAARGRSTDSDARLAHPTAESVGTPVEGVANLRERLPRQVTLRRILNLSVADFSGHVFNLETESNWYVADGVARHNCRCSVLPVVDDAKGLELGPLVLTRALSEEEKALAWKRYDKRLLPWERDVAQALRRGFREQESDVLDALEAAAS